MNFMVKTSKESSNQNGSQKRISLEAFKAKADAVVPAESVDKITGGALSGCHTGDPM